MSDKEKKVTLPKCWICMDRGVVTYTKKVDEREYEYAAHCICVAGENYRYDGASSKEKSEYYVPSVAKIFDPDKLARDNLLEFCRYNIRDSAVRKALIERGLNVEVIERQLGFKAS